MTFGLKNADTTYQRAMNLIFHDLLGIILEVYIDDVIVKSDSMDGHLADLCLALEKMRRYGLKMNPLKCAFAMSAGKFIGFIIHEHVIEIDPTKIDIAAEDAMIRVVLTQVMEGNVTPIFSNSMFQIKTRNCIRQVRKLGKFLKQTILNLLMCIHSFMA
jgi:hypothetical protein